MEVRRLKYPCPEIGPLLREFYSEHSFGGLTRLPLNEDRAWKYINAFLQNGTVFGIQDNGRLVGSLALHEAPFWWSDSTALWDGWFFVAKDYRTTRAAERLLRTAKTLSDAKGIPLIITTSHSLDLERKTLFFEKRGFRVTGASFMYGGE